MEKKTKNPREIPQDTLAMIKTPMQKWKGVYAPEQALKAGTMFEELDKPFFMGGEKRGK